MRLSELQSKTIVNLIDGKNIGNIVDVSVDENGSITGLMIEKRRFFISLFSSKKEMVIKWNNIEKIGEDVILVNVEY